MDRSHWKLFVRSAVVCIIGVSALSGFFLKRIDPLPLDLRPLKFDSRNAHKMMWKLSKSFPYRLPWHPNKPKATAWIQDQFRAMGYEPQVMPFSEVIAGKQYTDLKNVYVVKPGRTKPDEIVIAVGHYDTTDTTVEGAMDDASGVSVVLELARIFKTVDNERTLLFMASDSEEFGAFWGSHAFIKTFDRIHQVVAVASFDFVAPEEQVAILSLNDGLKSDYTPLWLRELALDSLRSVGSEPGYEFEARDMNGFLEMVERAVLIPPAEHGAFLQAGIPAFNWVGQMSNFAHQMAHYHHTVHDRAEIILEKSLAQYGRSAERFLYSVDSIKVLPDNFKNSDYLKVSSTLVMPGFAVRLFQALLFFPFLLFAFSKGIVIFRKHPRRRWWGVIRNEAQTIGVTLTAFFAGFAVMKILPSLKIITLYETFPATQKSPFLENPNFIAMLIVVAAVVLVYWILNRAIGVRHEVDPETSSIRQSFHSVLLALVICAAFVRNSYLAVLLLLPPAYLWPAIWVRKEVPGRMLNFLLMLGGSITLVVVALALTTVFHVGAVYWYVFLAATYGLISVYSVTLFFMSVSIMIRIFRSFVVRF